MNNSGQMSGSRAATRARILDAFKHLLLEGSDRPLVSQVILEAAVGRSTFYDHFSGAEALFNESLGVLFGALAKGLVGQSSRDDFEWWIDHIHENRGRGRDLLSGPKSLRIEALFVRSIEQEMAEYENRRLQAVLIAGMTMGLLRAWLNGQIAAMPSQMTDRLLAAATSIRQSDSNGISPRAKI